MSAFQLRRLTRLEREYGLAMRRHYERGERPPRELSDAHRRAWVQLRRLRGEQFLELANR